MSKVADRAGRWVYRGVWGVLVGWLRVPDEAPNVPPGSGEVVRSLRPAPGFLRYLKVGFWVLAVIFDVVIIGVWVLILAANPIAGAITAPVFWGLAIVPDIFAYVALHVRFDTTWYVVTERAVRIRRGVWIITENTITFENVQNVSVRQGPLQRHFGIAKVLVQTAGGGGSAAGGGHLGGAPGAAGGRGRRADATDADHAAGGGVEGRGARGRPSRATRRAGSVETRACGGAPRDS
ncbi:MAG: PH domain-containing protein [Planctomycetota bacterium]|nr:MAG: PH domain-containing protein [Planctomycetota bacterium]